MTSPKARRRPPIHMIDTEAELLSELAVQTEGRLPQVSALLLEEITRATLHTAKRMPRDIVTMQATVRFVDVESGKDSTYQLTYPQQADVAAGRISILTPIGAGLIGLREGQSILWPNRAGHERELKIIEVLQAAQPELRTA
jgi:regulator of nucleoside diphosphate kinase